MASPPDIWNTHTFQPRRTITFDDDIDQHDSNLMQPNEVGQIKYVHSSNGLHGAPLNLLDQSLLHTPTPYSLPNRYTQPLSDSRVLHRNYMSTPLKYSVPMESSNEETRSTHNLHSLQTRTVNLINRKII